MGSLVLFFAVTEHRETLGPLKVSESRDIGRGPPTRETSLSTKIQSDESVSSLSQSSRFDACFSVLVRTRSSLRTINECSLIDPWDLGFPSPKFKATMNANTQSKPHHKLLLRSPCIYVRPPPVLIHYQSIIR